ncbi:MAG: carbohydrate-binding protein [Victivallales bacterium]|nr:carbohydrate-binding protein [Victivallales bacterium]
MRHVILIVCAGLALNAVAQLSGAVFHYDFRKEVKVDLQSGAAIADGALKLNGKGDFAYVPNSENMHLTESGMTLVATVKMNENGVTGGANDSHDMFLSKGKEFIFGRSTNSIYFNFNDGNDWCATTMAKDCTASSKWMQYAAVVERFNDRAQGFVGYRALIYANGELVTAMRFLGVAPKPVSDLVEIGKGFGGGPWFFSGDIATVSMYDRPLTPNEIDKLATSEPLVKIERKGFSKVPASLEALLDTQHPSAVVKWALASLKRASVSGFDNEIIQEAAERLVEAPIDCNFKELANILSKRGPFRIVMTDALVAMLVNGRGTGAHPLLGVIDRADAHEVFGEKSIEWKITYRSGKNVSELESWQDVRWSCDVSKNAAKIVWDADFFKATSVLTFKDARIESTMSVDNKSKDILIDSVEYPIYRFAHLDGDDRMAYPYMSGVEIQNPTVEAFKFGQQSTYPSGSCSMAFGAYYNGKRGIYYGFEDGLARTKEFHVVGRRGNLNVSWKTPVAYDGETLAPNSYLQNGVATIELYSGAWFEAGQIFRSFLEKNASWWIRDLPRKSTPEWFRNNTMWFINFTGKKETAEDIYNLASYLRTYFGLPFGFHWYSWDSNKYGWPHFPIQDFTSEYNRKFQEAGIYTVPYIDSRLWKINDGPDHTDYMYKSHGLAYAVRDRNNNVHNEDYGKDSVYTIMCPAVPEWQDWIANLVERVASYGFNGVYHDQVATGSPRICYNPEHGHPLNDASLWLEKGYWPMFNKIFAQTRKDYPEFCHTTEENSDPYLKQFDGYMVWRWTDCEQIPLFQSIYSGRAQFVGRLFNTHKPGDKQSFFSKVAQQLVNSEQIGWYTIYELKEADERRLFVKKAMHTRDMLLYWFNEGRMLPPLEFSSMPMEKTKWGGNLPQVFVSPAIASSAWVAPDGSKVFLFVNTQEKAMSAILANETEMWVCKEGADEPKYIKELNHVSIEPRSVQIWTTSMKHANNIQKRLREFTSFDCGKPFMSIVAQKASFKANANKKIKGEPGKAYGVKDTIGYSGCSPDDKFHHFGWLSDAVIMYGEVDFGDAEVAKLQVNVTVDPAYEGGEIAVMADDKIVGTLTLKSTGGWENYKTIDFPLTAPLKGRRKITFSISGNAACNFASWNY